LRDTSSVTGPNFPCSDGLPLTSAVATRAEIARIPDSQIAAIVEEIASRMTEDLRSPIRNESRSHCD
jgi:hypothetical protein